MQSRWELILENAKLYQRATKRYDKAKTPYHRVLASEQVDQDVKARLRETFDQLNPAELRRRMRSLKARLDEVRRERELPTKSAAIQEGLAAFP
jgi:hypothetical protein